MKLIIAAILLSLGAFAQDGYHSYPEQHCQTQDCLIIGDSEIGFVSYYDLDGFEIKKLNSGASFTDVVHEMADMCFTGDSAEVENILKALAGNSEMQYYQGAHQMVRELEMESTDSKITLVADIRSDYEDYVTRKVISKCE